MPAPWTPPPSSPHTPAAGGHKDEYIATYYNYTEGPNPEAAFNLPEDMDAQGCKPATPDAAALAAAAAAAAAGKVPPFTWTPGALLRQFAQHMPSVHWGHAAYDSFVHRWGQGGQRSCRGVP